MQCIYKAQCGIVFALVLFDCCINYDANTTRWWRTPNNRFPLATPSHNTRRGFLSSWGTNTMMTTKGPVAANLL